MIFFENPKKKKQWLDPGQAAQTTPKRDFHGKKVMLCIWWDMKGVVWYDLLEQGQTINSRRYSQQLRRLNEELDLKRPFSGHGLRPLILLHDNARPHVVGDLRKHLDEFFASKPQSFYRDGIRQLPNRWQMVISNEGNYFNED